MATPRFSLRFLKNNLRLFTLTLVSVMSCSHTPPVKLNCYSSRSIVSKQLRVNADARAVVSAALHSAQLALRILAGGGEGAQRQAHAPRSA